MHFNQLLRVMHLTGIFLVLFCIHLSANVVSQSVSLQGDRINLETIFSEIRKQTGYYVVYDEGILRAAKPVSVDVKNMPLQLFLVQVLKDQPLTFILEQTTVVIRSNTGLPGDAQRPTIPISDSPPIKVSGTVVGPVNQPLAGATIYVKGQHTSTTSDDAGHFELMADAGSVLIISYVGFKNSELRITGTDHLKVVLEFAQSSMDTTEVIINTGYQSISKERATGSFHVVGNRLLNRRVSSDILSRIQDIVPGMYFNPATSGNEITDPASKIRIRGTASVSPFVNAAPLIVLDNFPYEGDINNINPNDIDAITVLKDAAAASIWGARSGNGVIVITTKKGRLNQKPHVQLNANATIGGKPDIYYDKKYLSSSDFISVERALFDNGYYDLKLSDFVTYPAVSPVIEILEQQRNFLISSEEAETLLNQYRQIDMREDYAKYIQQKSIQQQYAVNLTGGGNAVSYYLGLGFDKGRQSFVGNGQQRFSVDASNTYIPARNLEISTQLLYTENSLQNNNNFIMLNRLGGEYRSPLPYARLADESGNALPVFYKHRAGFTDSLGNLGFSDWKYRPLDEIKNGDRISRSNSLLIRAKIRYQFTSFLNAEVQYQREKQNSQTRDLQSESVFATRDLINQFAQYDPATGLFTYPVPRGSILNYQNGQLTSNNMRGQINFSKDFGDHSVHALAGAEIREVKTSLSYQLYYGYNDEYGSSAYAVDYVNYLPTNGGYGGMIPPPPSGISATTQRFISYYGNASYTYKGRYSATFSGRRDGANIFGVRTNDRITPLWSSGIGWELNKENFYDLKWLPSLKLRATYGYNGNVYNGSAYLTSSFGNTDPRTNLPFGLIVSAPNSTLRWEKVRNINIGLDFQLLNNILSGTIELFRKNGSDLIEDIPLPTSTGFELYKGNAARTSTRGLDIRFTADLPVGPVRWQPELLGSFLSDRVSTISIELPGKNLVTGGHSPGYSVTPVFSYRWAGLDADNGDPLGYLGKDVSRDYAAIVNKKSVDSLVYHGSASPRIFGSFRNNFSFKGLNVSANISYRFKYYIRRAVTALSYEEMLNDGLHQEYTSRWQNPGDEVRTNVPSSVYTTDMNRDMFYAFSEITVEKGDHIRLQDISISYDLSRDNTKWFPFRSAQLYLYLNNIGIIWKANKADIDPDAYGSHVLPAPKTFSIGIRSNF